MMIMVTGLTASVVMFLAGVYTWDYLFTQYLPYMLLLGFSEGWLSGMAMTLMVVYKPEWVSTFDDRTYLMNK